MHDPGKTTKPARAINTGPASIIENSSTSKERASEHTTFSVASLRINEITRVFRARYGTELPDDDAGRDDLQFMFEQLAWCRDARKRMHNFAELWAKWLSPVELEALVRFALAQPP
jgi:hypothetical protein